MYSSARICPLLFLFFPFTLDDGGDLERRLGEPQVWSDGPEAREKLLSLVILD